MSPQPFESVDRRATEALQSLFIGPIAVNHLPSFPRPDRSFISIFQVVFTVGPGTDQETRAQVHAHFERALPALAQFPEACQSELALRARRFYPEKERPEYPRMYIECAWHGSALAAMQVAGFGAWHQHCYSYVNRLDPRDPYNIDTRTASRGGT